MVKVEAGDTTVGMRVDSASRTRIPSQLEAVTEEGSLNVPNWDVAKQVDQGVLIRH